MTQSCKSPATTQWILNRARARPSSPTPTVIFKCRCCPQTAQLHRSIHWRRSRAQAQMLLCPSSASRLLPCSSQNCISISVDLSPPPMNPDTVAVSSAHVDPKPASIPAGILFLRHCFSRTRAQLVTAFLAALMPDCPHARLRSTCTAHPWLIPLWSNYEKKRRRRFDNADMERG